MGHLYQTPSHIHSGAPCPLRLALLYQTGSHFHSGAPPTLRMGLLCLTGYHFPLDILSYTWPLPSDWSSPVTLHSTSILGLCPHTGPPPSFGSLSSDQASPECRITVTDTYNDFPTRASAPEGSTPLSRTFRSSLASPLPSSIWGRKEGSERGRGAGEGGGSPKWRRLRGTEHLNTGEGLGQRNPLVTILDPKDDEGDSIHILPIQEPERQEGLRCSSPEGQACLQTSTDPWSLAWCLPGQYLVLHSAPTWSLAWPHCTRVPLPGPYLAPPLAANLARRLALTWPPSLPSRLAPFLAPHLAVMVTSRPCGSSM